MLGHFKNILVLSNRDLLVRFNFLYSEKWNARITDLRKQVEELFERKYGKSKLRDSCNILFISFLTTELLFV